MSGCETVSMRPKGGQRLADGSHLRRQSVYLPFWIDGEQRVNVEQVCNWKTCHPNAKSEYGSGLCLGIITLGIYTPRTVKVWCGGDPS